MKIQQISIPKIGEGVYEVKIIKISVKIGQKIKEGDTLLEISTDKVNSELPSPICGTIKKILITPGLIVKIGTPVIQIESSDDLKQTFLESNNFENSDMPISQNQKNITSITNEVPKTKNYLSPLVKKIIKSHDLSLEDIEKIPGTGRFGRLTKRDLDEFLSHYGASSQKIRENINKYIFKGDEIKELDHTRMAIMDNMNKSLSVPQVCSFIEIDITNIVKWKTKKKKKFFDKYKIPLTYTSIFIKYIAQTLKEYPQLNSYFINDKVILKKLINIGFAVNTTDNNLFVPVIKEADKKHIHHIQKDIVDLSNKVKNNTIVPEDMINSTFTISNIGKFNSLTGTPLVVPPQVGVLAIGNIRDKLTLNKKNEIDTTIKNIEERQICMFSFSYDHRVIDGALAGNFLNSLSINAQNLESDIDF